MPDTVPDNRRWVLEEIQRDAEADVHRFEGQPFTGQTVAAYLGCQAAAISALARVVATLLPDPPAAAEPNPEPVRRWRVTQVATLGPKTGQRGVWGVYDTAEDALQGYGRLVIGYHGQMPAEANPHIEHLDDDGTWRHVDPHDILRAPKPEPLSPLVVPQKLLDGGDVVGMVRHFAKRAADEDEGGE